MANHPNQTRIVVLTAVRTYVGQHTVEIPAFCRNDRFRGIVAGGGATARFLAGKMRFDGLLGTGLAQPFVTDAKADHAADFDLSEIAACLRADGFIF
jgi:hypothetical protein